MELRTPDYSYIVVFFLIVLGIRACVAKKSGKDHAKLFLSGKIIPWLLGVLMVVTMFYTDTLNLATDVLGSQGVLGNWESGFILLLGLSIVFVDVKTWRKYDLGNDKYLKSLFSDNY